MDKSQEDTSGHEDGNNKHLEEATVGPDIGATIPQVEPLLGHDAKAKGMHAKDFARRVTGTRLWKQILELTRPVTINNRINGERGFYWPERREHTEKIVKALLEKRILFIRACSEDWLYAAVQRLASVLQSAEGPAKMTIRRTQSRDMANRQQEFGFWIGERPLPYPVVIFISSGRLDFIQKFLDQQKGTILNDFYTELQKLNLYIVCEVDESSNKRLFATAKPWHREVFAFWDLPVIKLQLLRQFKEHGEAFYNGIEQSGLSRQYGENAVFEQLPRLLTTGEDGITLLKKYLDESVTNSNTQKETLIHLMEGEDFIKKLLIFCASFFEGLYYPDFFRLVSMLLEGEIGRDDNTSQTIDRQAPSETLQKPLKPLWEKNADAYLKACMLRTKKDVGNLKVEFIAPGLSTEMADYIQEEQYPFFHRIYQNFSAATLLINTSLSEKLETATLLFFARAASMDTGTHNALWLKNVVHGLWQHYHTSIPKDADYETLMRIIRNRAELADIIYNRIPGIISSLLANNHELYHTIIKDFFRLLLSERGAKRMAVIIASHIYRTRKHTKTLSPEDLMGYFRRTLEEGNWNDSFFGYDALTDNMAYDELFKETQAWLDNTAISEKSWTKQFAYLYQLDYILTTLYRYFRKFKAEGVYELWQGGTENNPFTASFTTFIKRFVSPGSIAGMEKIIGADANYNRFCEYVTLFEAIEADEIQIPEERLAPPFDTAVTLIADALEAWFYILVYPIEDLSVSPAPLDSWIAYALLLREATGNKLMSAITRYWSSKTGLYSLVIQEIDNEATRDDEAASSKKRLRKRRASLRTLLRLCKTGNHH
jgi:hypothetical protein